MVYERTRRIPDHEVDFTGAWRLSSALNEMQEIAELHANVLGIGREALGQAGVFWIVSRICVQMREYPTWGEEVLVRTWPENVGNRIFPRHFSFSRPNGETLGAELPCSCSWTVRKTASYGRRNRWWCPTQACAASWPG